MSARASAAAPVRPDPAVVQRKCACEAAEADHPLRQPTPGLGKPGDRWEQEADRIADAVAADRPAPLTGPLGVTPLVQRQAEEEEDERPVQAKGAAGTVARAALGRAAAAVGGGGRPLSAAERSWFEPRFGRSFAGIRVHETPAAAAIGARAYALGSHVAVAPGVYDPESRDGRRLMAHELAHTLQQGAGSTIRRTCPRDPDQIPAGGCKEFEKAALKIRTHRKIKRLNLESRREVQDILQGARASNCPMYYADKLTKLFGTDTAPSSETAERGRKRADEAVAAEEERLRDPVFASLTGTEEALTRASDRQWTTKTGKMNKSYRLDETRLDHMVVHMKVLPTPAGKGTDDDVKKTKKLEDGIELEAKTLGYTLDVEFVDTPGPDVFEVGVDPSKWTTAANWSGSARAIAHEAHHLLGLEDRYNYIEAHAENVDMAFDHRIHWFREQMARPQDPMADQSLMQGSKSTSPVNPQDLCALVSGDYRTCMVERFALRSAGEIAARAAPLAKSYHPENAAMLNVLRDAWRRRPLAERWTGCDTKADPSCATPPLAQFGDTAWLAADEVLNPLQNPHDPPDPSSMAKKRRAPCPK